MTTNTETTEAKPPPKLELVTPSEDVNINVLLYGPPKTGKTIGACSAAKPLLHVNADRPNATRLAHDMYEFDEVRFKGLDTMIAVMAALDEGHYRTVVLDTLGEMYRVLLEDLSGRALRPKIQQYGDTGTHLERFCRALCDKPVNVVLVCHEIGLEDEEAGLIERVPYTGTKNPILGEKLMAVVDVVGYTGVVREGDDVSYIAQLFSGGGRKGGSRWPQLGRARELNLEEWETTIRKGAA